MNSLFAVFLSEALEEATQFYVKHFGFEVVFKADWYVQLHYRRAEAPPLELAFMLPDTDVLPESLRASSATNGAILTLDFDDVDQIYRKLIETGAVQRFLLDLKDEDWGQRHFMFVDPSGLTVDVVQLIEPSAQYKQAYSGFESGSHETRI